jgi:hypothetical protein
MKKLQHLLSALLLSLLFLCFFEKATAQCGDKNQYLMEVRTGKVTVLNQFVADTKGITVFNRIDFSFSNITQSSALLTKPLVYPIFVNFGNGSPTQSVNENQIITQNYDKSGVYTIRVRDGAGFNGDFTITIRSLSGIKYEAPARQVCSFSQALFRQKVPKNALRSFRFIIGMFCLLFSEQAKPPKIKYSNENQRDSLIKILYVNQKTLFWKN